MLIDAGIYAIENLRVRSAYVGATKRGFLRRWATHRHALNLGTHKVINLQMDWNRYGSGWFKFVSLEVVSITDAFAPREQYWMDRLRSEGYSCYNLVKAYEKPLIPLDHQPISMATAPLILTVWEVADYLKVTTVTVRAMLRDGQLQGFRVRNVWRVTREQLQSFLDQRPPPPDEPDMC